MEFYTGALRDKVVFVTGGGGGIGAAACKAFARAGAAVAVVDLKYEAAERAVREIGAMGGKALAIACDVTDYASVEQAYEKANEAFGGIDVVYACAGVLFQRTTVEDSDVGLWKKTIDVCLVGAYHTVRAAIPYLKARGGGRIITMGSGRGRRAGGLADYSSAKAGQWMLVRNLAQELMKYHISVNEVVPGGVDTDMNRDIGAKNDKIISGGPDVMKKPEDVIPILMFVATQSNVVGPTGQTFSLNRREIC